MTQIAYKDLSPEQLKELRAAINRTWRVIAADVGEPESMAEQVEVTLDADYLETFGRLSKEMRALFNSLSYEDQDKVAYTAFDPYLKY